jgi:hypothetical protein
MKMNRVWVPIDQWEELAYNMWGEALNRKRCLEKAIIFTSNHRLYGSYMLRVTTEWPFSCLNALTDYGLNRRAWIGHAACALALRCPEDITRQAWGHLSDEQRILANRQADRAIESWEVRYRQGTELRKNVGAEVLPSWHSRRGSTEGGSIRQGSVLASSGHSHTQK